MNPKSYQFRYNYGSGSRLTNEYHHLHRVIANSYNDGKSHNPLYCDSGPCDPPPLFSPTMFADRMGLVKQATQIQNTNPLGTG